MLKLTFYQLLKVILKKVPFNAIEMFTTFIKFSLNSISLSYILHKVDYFSLIFLSWNLVNK